MESATPANGGYMPPKPKNQGRKQMFDNPLLEKLTHTHAAVPITLYLLIGAGLFTYSLFNALIGVLSAVLLFFAGWLTFTLVEYGAHRFLFHMEPDTPMKQDLTYKFHGVHHEYPKDKKRLAMPPVVSVLLVLGFFFFFRLLMGEWVFAFLPGFLVGYAAYLGVHYAVHAYPPPKNFLRTLWVHHSIHHYKDHDSAFGVSSPLWDYVFGTMPKQQSEKK